MQVGDLVYDCIDFDLGIVTKTKYEMDSKFFFVVFFNGDVPLDGWYGDTELCMFPLSDYDEMPSIRAKALDGDVLCK